MSSLLVSREGLGRRGGGATGEVFAFFAACDGVLDEADRGTWFMVSGSGGLVFRVSGFGFRV